MGTFQAQAWSPCPSPFFPLLARPLVSLIPPPPSLSSPCYRLMTNYMTFVVGEVLLLILTICSLAAIFPRVRAAFPFGSEALRK